MRHAFWLLGAALVGLTVFEISMQPSWPERLELTAIFSLMAVVMWASARWLPVVARRNRSIRVTLAVLALVAFSIVVGGALAVGNRMFLSDHDLTLLLVVVAFGVVAAVGFALSVSRPLTDDLDRLADRAAHVAEGDFEPPIGLDRRDEVGRLSRALSNMISQLARARAEREADEKSRRDFFAAIGHDLRTPLSSIRAATEAVKDGVGDDPHRYLEAIERDIQALSDLVEDVYLLARLDSGGADLTITGLDVTEVADESVEILRPVADRKRVALTLEADGRHIALGSAEAVGRVIRNLVDNAIRHAPEDGSVEIEVSRDDASIVTKVTDTGPGFEASFSRVAFDRFSRPEGARSRETGGSGLGLAIAKGLVEAMDGEIWITNSGHGEVAFRLSVADASRRHRASQALTRPAIS